MEKRSLFLKGIAAGVPIGLGYFAVSVGIGVAAVSAGLNVITALLISMTNLTSAGQVAGIGIIAAGGGYIEMALAQLIINMRYALMSLSLSQKLERKYSIRDRIITAFGITDEVFAVASGKGRDVSAQYMYGLITLPYIFWAAGTAFGAILGGILPEFIKSALGIAIYGMFIAIVIPPAKKSRGILGVAVVAAVLSCILYYVPIFSFISSGISIIICTIIAAALGALLFPQNIKEDGENE